MKYKISKLSNCLVLLACFILIFPTIISATSFNTDNDCRTDSGYNRCRWAEADDRHRSGLYAEITAQFHTIQTEGRRVGSYVTGPTYIDYKYDAVERGYMGVMFEEDWNDAFARAGFWDRCNDRGCNFRFDEDLGREGRFYLTQQPGDKWEAKPVRILFAAHAGPASGGWDGYVGHGWGWGYSILNTRKQVECYGSSDCSSNEYCDKSGEWQDWSCEVKECEVGETQQVGRKFYECESYKWVHKGECESGIDKCDGFEYIKCENYEWNNKGKVVGECGWAETTHYLRKVEENECIEVGLFPTDTMTEHHYETLEECEDSLRNKHIHFLISSYNNVIKWFKGLF